MRKRVISVATAIVIGMATTATGTVAFARGGGGGGGHGWWLWWRRSRLWRPRFCAHGFAMGHGSFGHGHLGDRRFGNGLYGYGGYGLDSCDLYYYYHNSPNGCDAY